MLMWMERAPLPKWTRIIAVRTGGSDVYHLLVKKGADAKVGDDYGYTPEHLRML